MRKMTLAYSAKVIFFILTGIYLLLPQCVIIWKIIILNFQNNGKWGDK